jgi:hypothetical protein
MGMNTGYGSYKNITGTGNVSTGACSLNGFYVNSTSTGTLVLRDGGAGGTVMTGTITPAIGWHELPVSTGGILHATIANTLNVTFSFQPTPAGS